MEPEIGVIELAAHEAASLRFESEPAQLDFDIESALSDIWSYLEEKGSAPSGAPFAIFHHMKVDTPLPAPLPLDIEAGFPIAERLRADPRVRTSHFAASSGVRIVHRGDYRGLPDAMRILQAWIEAYDRQPAGPPRVIFYTDPAAVIDSGEWRSEIFWPLAP